MHANQFLVGMASLVLEILLLFLCFQKQPKFPFEPCMGIKKMELAQKIHASRGICEMHPSQFW